MISIIVPVYNVEPWLRQCIESIICQTYHNLDIILIDDGSTDNSGAICDEYAAQDTRIRAFHIEHCGLSGARNFGIERAMEVSSEYIGFVDGDDWIEPEMFEVLLRYAEESGSEVVCSGRYSEQSTSQKTIPLTGNRMLNSTEAVKALIKGHIRPSVWNKLWKKECFEAIRFPQGHVYEDSATVYKIFSVVNSVKSIPYAFYHYRLRNGSIIHTHSIDNLIDLWIAYKSRYVFLLSDCRFNKDVEIIEKSLDSCAYVIARNWLWYYASPKEEREKYSLQMKEMRDFSKQHFPKFGKCSWPFNLRFCIFVQKIDSPFVFPVLYYLNQFYRWCRKR